MCCLFRCLFSRVILCPVIDPRHSRTLLEGNVDIAQKGASAEFHHKVEQDVMGYALQRGDSAKIQKSAAQSQRDINSSWLQHGAFHQPHTQACLGYATSLQVSNGKSTMEADYIQHDTAYLYEPMPKGGIHADNIKTPFAAGASQYQIKIPNS